VFRSRGGGEEVVAEVLARRLRSPVDSVIWLSDAAGMWWRGTTISSTRKAILRTDLGAATHHADSYLRAKLPQDGAYFLRLADAQRQGGDGFGLAPAPERPAADFLLTVTPSAINIRGGSDAHHGPCASARRVRRTDHDPPQNAPAGFRSRARPSAGGAASA